MVLLDSSVWVAFFNEDDLFYQQAVGVFGKINEEIILPYAVATEVATVLSYKVSKQVANLFIEEAINNQDIQIINNDFPREAVFFLNFKEKMSFQDISVVHLSRQNGYRLISFDKQQLRLLKKTPPRIVQIKNSD